MGVLYLLRHGQASFGAADYDRLSPTGLRQSALLGRALQLRGVQPTAVFSGTMQRHRETADGALAAWAEANANANAGPTARTEHPGINEFDHQAVIVAAEPRYADPLTMMADMAAGGDPRRAFQHFFRAAVMRWVGGAHAADYAEPWAAFKSRSLAAFDELAAHSAGKATVLAFTSGGFISAVCARLLGLPDEGAFTINWTLANTGITKVVVGRDGAHLVSLNEHAHLEPEAGLLTYR